MSDEYVGFDDGSHFISGLQLVNENIRNDRLDSTNIRWIIIGLHDALYALLVEKLTRTDGFGFYYENFEDEVFEFYQKGGTSNSAEFIRLSERSLKQNVANLGILLKRLFVDSEIEIYPKVTPEISRPSRGISYLKEIRNYFSHPRPMYASFHEDLLQEAILDTIEVIKLVAEHSGQRATRHDPEEASILLKSIEYYARRWVQRSSRQA